MRDGTDSRNGTVKWSAILVSTSEIANERDRNSVGRTILNIEGKKNETL